MRAVFDEIRRACARVAERAKQVRIEPAGLAGLAQRLASDPPPAPLLDPAHHALADPAHRLAYVITLDAINFGSGWFPVLRKRPGCSGYFTLATALKERFERSGALTASELVRIDAPQLATLLGQDASHPEVRELLEHFARALRDLGVLLATSHGGSF